MLSLCVKTSILFIHSHALNYQSVQCLFFLLFLVVIIADCYRDRDDPVVVVQNVKAESCSLVQRRTIKIKDDFQSYEYLQLSFS
jgi:hypothetical protein